MSNQMDKAREEFEKVTNEIAKKHFCTIPKWNLEFVDGKYALSDVQIRFEVWQHQQSIIDAQAREISLLHIKFGHIHTNCGIVGDDSCLKCGLDLRHPIHKRAPK